MLYFCHLRILKTQFQSLNLKGNSFRINSITEYYLLINFRGRRFLPIKWMFSHSLISSQNTSEMITFLEILLCICIHLCVSVCVIKNCSFIHLYLYGFKEFVKLFNVKSHLRLRVMVKDHVIYVQIIWSCLADLVEYTYSTIFTAHILIIIWYFNCIYTLLCFSPSFIFFLCDGCVFWFNQ